MSGGYCSNVDRVLFLGRCSERCRGWSGSHIIRTRCSHYTTNDEGFQTKTVTVANTKTTAFEDQREW